MEDKFRAWLIKRGNTGAANNYPKAIHSLSAHYSKQTGTDTDIYSITNQNVISEIAHDYNQTGRFSDFGYQQHGRFRAAIGRYSEFFVQHIGDNHILEAKTETFNEIENSPLSTNFAYEKDLQTCLCTQISELFPEYQIYGEGTQGIEYLIGGRKIDVLLEHKTNGGLLAVELKSGNADFRVFGQISMYIGLLQERYPDKDISGVIVAGSIDLSLKQACAITDKVKLKIYRMSLELEDA